ncbi:hypothetical protein DFH06DRAFT_216981 [Mycena polygramma]|nr:hypothetical protein DFH06DRAFT_216981 [Mycena polygramma]
MGTNSSCVLEGEDDFHPSSFALGLPLPRHRALNLGLPICVNDATMAQSFRLRASRGGFATLGIHSLLTLVPVQPRAHRPRVPRDRPPRALHPPPLRRHTPHARNRRYMGDDILRPELKAHWLPRGLVPALAAHPLHIAAIPALRPTAPHPAGCVRAMHVSHPRRIDAASARSAGARHALQLYRLIGVSRLVHCLSSARSRWRP